ncbi:MAG: hypothetical protein C3F14_01160 [Deltaproteobacteria bacterium]|nr:MAG: hypothetical protein C3F14_01160 [Deltaproteobacteria bacterium]
MHSNIERRKRVGKSFRGAVGILFAVALTLGMAGCSKTDGKNEIVASVNGEDIKVGDLREILGVAGGATPTADVPPEKKKEALDRLVSSFLLAQDARGKGLDNTTEYKQAIAQSEQGILIAALFRKEMEAKGKAGDKEIEAEAKKLREADKNLSEKDAKDRAGKMLSSQMTRKVQEDLIAAAKKDTPTSVDKEQIQKIGKGENVGDDVILGTAGTAKVSYGDIKRLVGGLSPDTKTTSSLLKNPMMVERITDRELTSRALAAYAKKQGVEGSETVKTVRKNLERSVLISLLADKVVLKDIPVTDKEIGEAYAEHATELVRNGKKVPLSEVKEQIRGFLQNNKKKKVLDDYIEGLKKKAKITINESVLQKV